MINHFSGDGESTGHEVSDDPELINLCRSSFAAIWARAVPHDQYRPT
jgi:hypothetical protein